MSAEDLLGTSSPPTDSGWYEDLYRGPTGAAALDEWFPRKVLSFQTRYRVVRADHPIAGLKAKYFPRKPLVEGRRTGGAAVEIFVPPGVGRR